MLTQDAIKNQLLKVSMPVNNNEFIDQFKIALNAHEFQRLRFIQGMTSISGLSAKSGRSGTYTLVFANQEIYVGQAKDVTRRYVQHCKNHTDIAYIAFKPTAIKRLNEIERSVIGDLEVQGFDLRNITLTSIPKGDSDFELNMPQVQQDAWLTDYCSITPQTQRADYKELRRKNTEEYRKYLELEHTDDIISVLKIICSLLFADTPSHRGFVLVVQLRYLCNCLCENQRELARGF